MADSSTGQEREQARTAKELAARQALERLIAEQPERFALRLREKLRWLNGAARARVARDEA